MDKQEFIKKHKEYLPLELFTTTDVLKRVAANLSDLQYEFTFFTNDEISEKLNMLKGYMFDYIEVMLEEEREKRKNTK
jgi:hypothetical protein